MAAPTVIRSPLMRLSLRLRLALAACVAAALPAAAAAQIASAPDSSLLIVFENDVPVAHERSSFVSMGDSIVVSAVSERKYNDEKGVSHPYKKTMVVVIDSRDLGLIRYMSVQDFDGHSITRGVLPGDTSMTYFDELDGGGDADRLVQPPGRLFVMDAPMFTLFDVISRSLVGKTFTSRRVQLLALQRDQLTTPLATVTAVGSDTLRLGRIALPARHYTLADSSAVFDFWADGAGRLVRLSHEQAGIRVERSPEEASSAPKATRPAASRRKSSGAGVKR